MHSVDVMSAYTEFPQNLLLEQSP